MSSEQTLTPSAFGAFYRELYPDRDPYRWHERAARELADGTAWREDTLWEALCAPTGTGKTSLIECFLFALACTHGRSMLPRRLFWVVDRRNVADQVYLHACRVLNRLERAPSGGLAAQVHKRLDDLADQTTAGETVQLRLWRGGLAGEAALDLAADDSDNDSEPRQEDSTNLNSQLQAERLRAPLSPCAAAIVCSTVDQVGSRMLFRGYGISRRSRPVEAALVGTGSLIVLDEAHLSRPFHTTATSVAARQSLHDRLKPVRGVQVLAVTATHPRSEDDHCDKSRHTFELGPEERRDPALARQMAARRPVTLEKGRDPATTCAKAAQQCVDNGAKVVGVVANTVAAARKIASALKARSDTILVIGPARPLDQAQLLDRIPARENRAELERPLFVVGTQTLEVGLDIDFDALVTECAPLHSLVQRFGRLDRAGEMTAVGTPGRGAIVQPPSKGCPVYKEASTEAWKQLGVLESEGELDFSVESVVRILAKAPSVACQSGVPTSVLLEPWHLEMLVQTSHALAPEPDVSVFLRGDDTSADVNVCWRADLTTSSEDTWERRVALRPPHPGEMVSLPVWSARRWLTGNLNAAEFADFEGAPAQEEIAGHEQTRVVRVPPPDYDNNIRPETIDVAQVRAGDVIVVPASFGGCDEYGWNPASRRAVTDLGNLSQARPRLLLSATLGLSEDLLDAVRDVRDRQAAEELSQEEAYDELCEATANWLQNGSGYGDTPAGAAARLLARRLRHAPAGRAIVIDPSGPADLLLAPESARSTDARAAVPYSEHVEKVKQRVGCFARSLHLDDELAATLATAAQYHDVGKLDRRFQAWLNGGFPPDPIDEPLAKSARGPGTPESWIAQRDAGWPTGKRHEAISAALLDRVTAWPPSTDRDLLLHLVSAHHGDGRPLRRCAEERDRAGVDQDAEPDIQVTALIEGTEITVSSDAEIPWGDHARRFLALNEQFGPWGLATLESLLVLADRSVSAEGS